MAGGTGRAELSWLCATGPMELSVLAILHALEQTCRQACPPKTPAGRYFSEKHLQAGTSTENTCRQVLPPKTLAGRYFHQKHLQAGTSAKNTCRQILPPKTPAGRHFHQKHLQAGTSAKNTCRQVLPPKTPAGRYFHQTHLHQNVCRQTSWLRQAPYETYWNLLKTSAGRRFGRAGHHMRHTGTCSTRAPADVLDAPGTI